jgi:hypothetical protein
MQETNLESWDRPATIKQIGLRTCSGLKWATESNNSTKMSLVHKRHRNSLPVEQMACSREFGNTNSGTESTKDADDENGGIRECKRYQVQLFFRLGNWLSKKKRGPGRSFPLSKTNNHVPELHHLCELALYELCTFVLVPSTTGPTLIVS